MALARITHIVLKSVLHYEHAVGCLVLMKYSGIAVALTR